MRHTHDSIRSRSRLAGDVLRYHEWPVEKQTNAHHSWNCMRIFYEIFAREENVFPAKILVYLMYHDCGEFGVGDLPFPVKRESPELKKIMNGLEAASRTRQGITLPDLTAWESMVAKVCDMLEMFEYGLEQCRRGNDYGQPICDVTEEYLVGVIHKHDEPRLHNDDVASLRTYFHKLTGRYLP